MELRFEMRVSAADGTDVGWLDRILVDPNTREATHIVLRTPRLSEECLISLSEVAGNLTGGLSLRICESDLDHQPRYYEGRKSATPAQRVDYKPAISWAGGDQSVVDAEHVPAEACEIGPDTSVTLADGGVLALAGLATDDPTNLLASVTVRAGKNEYSVPAEWVGDISSELLTLATTREQLRRLVGVPGGPYITTDGTERGGKKAA
jgi:hypothetical protein